MLMLKDDPGHTIVEIEEERGNDVDLDRWRRRLLEAPDELSAVVDRRKRCRPETNGPKEF
jgi:hypothetical protein